MGGPKRGGKKKKIFKVCPLATVNKTRKLHSKQNRTNLTDHQGGKGKTISLDSVSKNKRVGETEGPKENVEKQQVHALQLEKSRREGQVRNVWGKKDGLTQKGHEHG